MKISFNWLQDWIQLQETDFDKIAQILSFSTSEVEETISQGQGLEKVFVGEIQKIMDHPNADKMKITETKVGDKILTIVCGAKNIRVGQKVPVALVGAILPGGFEIKKAEKRGIESCGMICSEVELNLAEESAGIMELENDAIVGTPLIEYLKLDDTIFEIENTTITNRPDLFSQIGYARELTALGLAQWKENQQNYLANLEKIQISNTNDFPLQIEVKDKGLFTRICGIAIKNFQVKKSPAWMQQRLKSCGIRPINNLVDITNYVMLELGMPLHAFDLDKINGKKVIIRKSKKGEKVTTLDNEQKVLPDNVIVLKDDQEIFDLCGIMGGKNSGIENNSTNIWLHSPVYDPVLIRRASLFLNHRTEASAIYEKKVPKYMAKYGLLRALELMQEVSPQCQISSQMLDLDTATEKTRTIVLKTEKLNKIVGEKLSTNFVQKTLENLGFTVKTTKKNYQIKVPPFRFKDINIEEDLVEEIIRIYGFNNIEPQAINIKTSLSQTSSYFTTEKKVKNALAQSAFEVINYSFIGNDLIQSCFGKRNDLIKIKNPLSQDINVMRPSLLPGLLKNIQDNAKNTELLSFFEIGKVFNKQTETKNIGYIAYEKSFYNVKNILKNIFKLLKLEIRIQPDLAKKEQCSVLTYHPGQTAQIIFRGKKIGVLGVIHPLIQKTFHLEKRLAFFEFDFTSISEIKVKPTKYKPFVKFPDSTRDQNLLIDKTTLVEEFLRKTQKKVPLLVSLKLIDVYEGKQVDNDKKSITLRAVYQSSEKTLTDQEVDNAHHNLLKQAERHGASIREN